jgi:putative copper export protein
MAVSVFPLLLEAASKVLVYGSLLLAVGVCAVRWLLLTRARGVSADEVRDSERRLARLILIATVSLTVALLFRLAAHTVAAFGAAEAMSIESIRVIALESRWGGGWRLQILAAAVAVSAGLLVRMQPRNGWVALAAAVLTCCLSIPLLGHAAGDGRRLAVHSVHVGAAGLWLGSLASILIACRPRAPFLRGFAPLALSGAALMAGAGGVMALEYVGSLSNLWTTAYGRALSVKLALFGAVLAAGYANWRRWRVAPAVAGAGGGDPPGSVRIPVVEVLIAVAIVLVTALLTELEHP